MAKPPSAQEKVVLDLLTRGSGNRWLYGLEMVKMDPSKLGRTSIYVVLTRMVARRLVKTRLETDAEQKTRGPKRRLYQATEYGRKVYEAALEADRRLGAIKEPRGAL